MTTNHYGPTWAWDQSRPEAIQARDQVAEFCKRGFSDHTKILDVLEVPGLSAYLLPKRFRQSGLRSWLFLSAALSHLKRLTNLRFRSE